MTKTPLPETYTAILQSFCDFLVVSTHTILYERSLYPPTAFLLTRKYNYPIRQCRHPQVCTWITDAVGAIRDELIKGTISRIVVAIHDYRQQVVERFVFDVGGFPAVDRREMWTLIERVESGEKGRPLVDLEEQFRGALSRLTKCSAVLKPLPKECSFTIVMEQKDHADPPLSHATPWIPVEPDQQRRVENAEGLYFEVERGKGLGGGNKVHPVRAVDTGDLFFEVWIEEREGKMENEPEASLPTSSESFTE